MDFFKGFKYIADDTEILAEGDYLAIITIAKLNQYIPNAVDVFFQIPGHKLKISPCKMTIFSRPVLNSVKNNGEKITEEDIKKWDFSFSRFIDAFKINQNELNNLSFWQKKVGYITVKKRKNSEYSDIFVAFNQHKNDKKEEKIDVVQQAINEQNKQNADERASIVAEALGGDIIKKEPITPENFKEDVLPNDTPIF